MVTEGDKSGAHESPMTATQSQAMGKVLSVITTADRHHAHNLALIARLQAFAIRHDLAVELIIIDDLKTFAGSLPPTAPSLPSFDVAIVQPAQSLGQLQAMLHGIRLASGDVVVTIDPDMHDNVEDIARLLQAHDDDKDVVYTWRIRRRDTHPLRHLLSRGYNHMLRLVFGVTLHDINTPMTLLSRNAVQALFAAPAGIGLHKLYLSHLFAHSFAELQIVINHPSVRQSSYSLPALIRLALWQLKNVLKTRSLLRSSPSHHVP